MQTQFIPTRSGGGGGGVGGLSRSGGGAIEDLAGVDSRKVVYRNSIDAACRWGVVSRSEGGGGGHAVRGGGCHAVRRELAYYCYIYVSSLVVLVLLV